MKSFTQEATIMTEPKGRKPVSSVYLALIAVWTALLLASSLLIVYPIPGTPASITFSSVLLSSLTAPLLGPLYGMASGFLFFLFLFIQSGERSHINIPLSDRCMVSSSIRLVSTHATHPVAVCARLNVHPCASDTKMDYPFNSFR